MLINRRLIYPSGIKTYERIHKVKQDIAGLKYRLNNHALYAMSEHMHQLQHEINTEGVCISKYRDRS